MCDMTPDTRQTIKLITDRLAQRVKTIMGSLYVQHPKVDYHGREVDLPPLRVPQGTLLDELVKAVYGNPTMTKADFSAGWGYFVSMVREGWTPNKPYATYMAELFPEFPWVAHYPRDIKPDSRGLLCQALLLSHYRMQGTTFSVTEHQVELNYGTRVYAALTARSITWPHGHYIQRKGLTPVDFRPWASRPINGSSILSVEAFAIRDLLVRIEPNDTWFFNTFFQCVAALGDEADQIVCEPFYVDITDDTQDRVAETFKLLEAQRQLKARK